MKDEPPAEPAAHDEDALARLRAEVESQAASLRAFARRTAVLQALMAELGRAMTRDEVGRIVAAHGRDLFGAATTFVYFQRGTSLVLAALSGTDPSRALPYSELLLDSPHPLTETVRTGIPLWFGTRAELLAVHPYIAEIEHPERKTEALVTLPLRDDGETLGGLAFTFRSPVVFDEVQRDFYLMVAEQAAQAIVRSRLFEAERAARAAIQRRQERTSIIAQVGTTLASTRDSREALAEIARVVVPALADWFAIDELAPDGTIRRVIIHHRDPAKLALAASLAQKYPDDPKAPSGVHQVLRTGIRQFGAHISDEMIVAGARDPEHLALLRELRLTSYAVVPIVARGKVVAALTLVGEGDRRLDEDDLVTAEELGRHAALALENARLFESVRAHADTLATLNELGRLISAELDHHKVVQAVNDAATALTRARFGAFFYNVLDERGGSYVLYTISGVPREAFSNFPMPRNTAVFAPTFNGEGVVRVADITRDPRYGHNAPHKGMPHGHLPVRSYLAAPVISRSGEVIGGIFLGHEEVGIFDQRAETIAVGLAAQAAVAIDNARLYGEARRLIRALEQSNRDLDQFAYVTSHDLKAPLRGISSLSEWIEDDLGGELKGETRKNLDLLRGRVRRMEGLINGILDYSRVGRAASKRENVDLATLLREVVELHAIQPPASVVLEGAMPVLHTDRVALQQVLMNLIGNALKHARRPDVQVRVAVSDANAMWEFAVHDNGPGILPAFHQRIWGIFQTLHERDKFESTGIGLAIVKKIVEARGGTVRIDSDGNDGATFRFTWPKRDEPS